MKKSILILLLFSLCGCPPGPDAPDPGSGTDFYLDVDFMLDYELSERTADFGADLSIYPRLTVDEESGAWFWQSEYLLDYRDAWFDPNEARVQYVTPESVEGLESWDEVLDPTMDVFAIAPGDYVDLGVFTPGFSGNRLFRKVFVFYSGDPDLDRMHPRQRKDRGLPEVVLEAFRLDTESFWLIHGITFRGRSVSKKGVTGGRTNITRDATEHNLIDYCLIENVAGATVIHGDYNQVQRSVVWQDFCVPGTDWGGIGIGAATGQVSLNCGIVACEVINTADGSGLPWNQHRDGRIDGARIENNDFYNTRFVVEGGQIKANAENAHDCKNRSGDPDNPILFLRNRMHGYLVAADTCSGTGAAGEIMVFHNNCGYMRVEGNIGFYGCNFLTLYHQNPKFPDGVTDNLIFENNIFANALESVDTRPGSATFGEIIPTTGLAVRITSGDVWFSSNTFSNAARGIIGKRKSDNPSYWSCNAFVDIGSVDWIEDVTLDVCSNRELDSGSEMLEFWYARWTGPKIAQIAGVSENGYIASDSGGDCDCAAGLNF